MKKQALVFRTPREIVAAVEAEKRTAEAKRLRAALARLVERGARICWSGEDWDGSDLQDFLVAEGHLVQEPYDQAKHGDNDGECEPGDPWYVLAPELRRALAARGVKCE